MLIRIRNKAGTWRQEASESEKLSEFLAKLEHAKSVKITKVSLTPNMDKQIHENSHQSLKQLGLKHGDMIYIDAVAAVNSAAGPVEILSTSVTKSVDSHGNIIASDKPKQDGFRPGLQSLRSQKLHWTLTDFVEYDNKYTFEIKGEQLSFCSSASLDGESCNSFQSYLHNFGFQTHRCGYLYGKFVRGDEIEGSVEYKETLSKTETKTVEDGKPKKYGETKRNMRLDDLDWKKDLAPKSGVIVHAIYEPLQQAQQDSFQLLEDPHEEVADIIAQGLGLEKVGVIFSHPPGRENFNFSTNEILFAGEQALEATDGKMDSPFVIVKVTSDQGNASFDAFSLTPQCLEMVAEDALVPIPETPGHSAINPVFTLIVEKKEAHVVDNDFFIKRVPILSHKSPYSSSFPRFNRTMGEPPSGAALKSVLEKIGRTPSNTDLAKALSDFNLLVFLSETFDADGMNDIVKFVASNISGTEAKQNDLAEGYTLMLYAVAGMD